MDIEGEDLMLKVALKRKYYPKKCSELLRRTLKIELDAVKSAVVKLDDAENENNHWQPSEKLKEEIANLEANQAETMDIVNKEADCLLTRLETIRDVLQLIKNDGSCKIEIDMQNFCGKRHSIECCKIKTTNKT